MPYFNDVHIPHTIRVSTSIVDHDGDNDDISILSNDRFFFMLATNAIEKKDKHENTATKVSVSPSHSVSYSNRCQYPYGPQPPHHNKDDRYSLHIKHKFKFEWRNGNQSRYSSQMHMGLGLPHPNNSHAQEQAQGRYEGRHGMKRTLPSPSDWYNVAKPYLYAFRNDADKEKVTRGAGWTATRSEYQRSANRRNADRHHLDRRRHSDSSDTNVYSYSYSHSNPRGNNGLNKYQHNCHNRQHRQQPPPSQMIPFHDRYRHQHQHQRSHHICKNWKRKRGKDERFHSRRQSQQTYQCERPNFQRSPPPRSRIRPAPPHLYQNKRGNMDG